MAVRRLHPEQPASFAFSPENLAWAKATIAKYPPGKEASAVLPLLFRAQEQHDGWLPEPAMRAVADMLGMAYIRVYEVATFYTMFQLAPVGLKAHVQVCGTTPCMLRGAEDLMRICKSKIHPEQHHLSADGAFSWEEVECLGSCANAPMVQVFKDTYEDLTPELFEALLAGFASGKVPKPGSQTGRTASCPAGGATTLKDTTLFDGSTIGAWKARFGDAAAVVAGASSTPQSAAPSSGAGTAGTVSTLAAAGGGSVGAKDATAATTPSAAPAGGPATGATAAPSTGKNPGQAAAAAAGAESDS
ncbi:MAG: NADH-quinone oxidoreductase subunit NuoE, partial [Hyphomicrobiaceae bacterium]